MLQVYPVLCRKGYMDNYAYVVVDEATKVTAVIDPSEAEAVIAKCEDLGLRPQFVLNTHHHFDHVDGNVDIKQKYGAKIVCNAADAYRIENSEILLKPGEYFVLGYKDEIKIQGNFFGLNSQILKNGETVGNINRQFSVINDAFELDADQDELPFLVALVIAIDNITDKKYKRG